MTFRYNQADKILKLLLCISTQRNFHLAIKLSRLIRLYLRTPACQYNIPIKTNAYIKFT